MTHARPRESLAVLLAASFLLAFPSLARAQEDDMSALLTPETRRSVDKGVQWLVENQNRDGSWGCQMNQAPATAITGLACLALMSDGSTPNRGRHRKAIAKGLRWILSVAREDGSITANDAIGLGLLYDHAAATLMLAELYGMDAEAKEDKEIKDKLLKAVQFMGRSQNGDGGWGSQPSGTSDIAITGMMFVALRAAHNAGIATDHASLDRLLAFVRSCQDTSGTFNQYPGMGDGGRLFYPTSAGLRVLVGMGEGDSKKVQQGCEWMVARRLGEDYGGQVSEWDYAGAFFAIQAVFPDRAYFDKWYPTMREQLMQIQHPTGYWEIQYCSCCRAYATAISLILLQAPLKILPLFQL
ncbi:MAG: terpene cyclase/mutase family protein [Planctomycetes bacterium]|nr:terpene cyclase/mutase family protein [Planctomycetota bacterium]